jgi:hypothetical protein
VGTDEDLIAAVAASGERVGERAWPLPINDDYAADVNTGNADVRNTSAWGAGAIAGATFLQRFADGVPWAHLDVASVSRDRRTARGATGFGLRLLVDASEHWPRHARQRERGHARRRTSKAGDEFSQESSSIFSPTERFAWTAEQCSASFRNRCGRKKRPPIL